MVTDATTTYRTVAVDGLNIFYREAGPRDAPTILLLHGFPSSSAMFASLIPRLADRYHLVAPDYPGLGLSDAPPPDQYGYTFDQDDRTLRGQQGVTPGHYRPNHLNLFERAAAIETIPAESRTLPDRQ